MGGTGHLLHLLKLNHTFVNDTKPFGLGTRGCLGPTIKDARGINLTKGEGDKHPLHTKIMQAAAFFMDPYEICYLLVLFFLERVDVKKI